jgi:hypothetical protein
VVALTVAGTAGVLPGRRFGEVSLVAPIEIRPISSADDGRPGAAVAAGGAVRPGQEGVPAGWYRPQFVYDANRDGPWPRTRQQLIAKANTLHEVIAEVREQRSAPNPDVRWEAVAEYVYGVQSAAYWTLALTDQAPIGLQPEPVTDATVKAQARLASAEGHRALADDDMGWLAYTTGVLAWLSWIVGAESSILWPEPTH